MLNVNALFVVLPCDVVVKVVPTPPWFLPGPNVVVHVIVPCNFVQLSGNCPAWDAGAANGLNISAAPSRLDTTIRFDMIALLSP